MLVLDTIVVAGSDGATNPGRARVRRYLIDGSPDPSFGNGTGLYELPIGAVLMQTRPQIEALAVESNGTVWLTGATFNDSTTDYTANVWRVDAAGTNAQSTSQRGPGLEPA